MCLRIINHECLVALSPRLVISYNLPRVYCYLILSINITSKLLLFVIVQINKIARILNAHTDSLQWAESSCTGLQRKLDAVANGLEQQRRDQERSFRFA